MDRFGKPAHPVPQSVWLLITLIISTLWVHGGWFSKSLKKQFSISFQKEEPIMKKILIAWVFFALVTCPVSILHADDWSWVLGGSAGYISSYGSVGSFFFARAGTPVVIISAPIDYSSTTAFGGVVSIDAPSAFLDSGYSSGVLQFTAPTDNLYLVVWVKSSGPSGDFLTAVADGSKIPLSLQARESKKEAETYPPELLERLQDATNKMLGQ